MPARFKLSFGVGPLCLSLLPVSATAGEARRRVSVEVVGSLAWLPGRVPYFYPDAAGGLALGCTLGRRVEVRGDIGRFRWTHFDPVLGRLARTGRAWDFEDRLRNTAVVATGRYFVRAESAVRPFVEVGAGRSWIRVVREPTSPFVIPGSAAGAKWTLVSGLGVETRTWRPLHVSLSARYQWTSEGLKGGSPRPGDFASLDTHFLSLRLGFAARF